ncbi:hypothetical protein MMC17_002845 [Xylographa soralifera]|nr:hypothetical protein [Xylographa soralifera]
MAQQSKELVKCHCSTCENYLFTSTNAWSRLSETYFTFSSDQPEDYSGTGLSPTFPNRAGSSELEGCEIQSLYCNQCSVQLGVKCIIAPLLKIQYKGRSFLKFAKVALKTIATGVSVSINIVDSSSTPLSFSLGATPESDLHESNNGESGGSESFPALANGRSAQKDEVKRIEKKLAQAIEVIGRQSEDIEKLLKSVTSLKQGLVSVQESVGRMETDVSMFQRVRDGYGRNQETLDRTITEAPAKYYHLPTEPPTDTVNIQPESTFVRSHFDAIHGSNQIPLHPAQPRPLQTARMTGPLARRPLEVASSTRSPTYTATIRGSPSSGINKRKSPVALTNSVSRDVSMSEDPPPPSANPFEDRQWQMNSQSRSRNIDIESSADTFGRGETITVESRGSTPRNNAIDRLMGPPAQPSTRPGPLEPVQRVRSSIENIPRSSGDVNEADTQEYLRRTVATDDAEDTDYEPSNRSQSPPSQKPSEMPASVEVQSSLDNILDPVTPAMRRELHGYPPSDSRDTDHSRRSWADNGGQTTGWHENAWGGPSEWNSDGTTPGRAGFQQVRGLTTMRRGVSRGSGRGAKRLKTAREGKVDGRSAEKQRDAEGYLLRADGTRDMRSARYRDKQSAERASGEPAEGLAGPIQEYDENHRRTMKLMFPERYQPPDTPGRRNGVTL